MKVAILGSGAMGATVIEHLKECPEVDGVVAYDRSQERLREVANRYHIQTTSQPDGVFNDPLVRLAFVTAANDAHPSLTRQAIGAGKAVMCEKPMATTLSDAREMVEFAEKHRAFLQIGFEARYSRLYVKVKEWIDAGQLGQVLNTHCAYLSSAREKGSWRNRKATGGSMFGEKLSHYVDLPRWWIGAEVKDVFSACAPNAIPYSEVHDNYHTICRFQNGAVSELTFMMAPAATFHGDPLQNVINQQKGDGHALRYLLVGTKGAAETNVFDRTIKRWEFGDSPQCMTSTWVETLTWNPTEDHVYFHNTRDQTHDIVRRVLKGLPPRTPARDAYETMKVCFAAEESADSGRIVAVSEMER